MVVATPLWRFGWGMYTINLALHWFGDPDVAPLAILPFDAEDLIGLEAPQPSWRERLAPFAESSLALQKRVGLFTARPRPYACWQPDPRAIDIVSDEEKDPPMRPRNKARRTGRRIWHPLDSLLAILRLGAGRDDRAALGQAMEQGLVDWKATAALAGQHLLLPALWPALSEKKLAAPMPEALRRFLGERSGGEGKNFLLALEEMYLANAARNAGIRRQALQAVAALNAAGIEPAALKGTRLLLAGDSVFARARCLRDIDLVVADSLWARAGVALEEAGYVKTGSAAHADSFIAANSIVEIDLHRSPLSLHAPAALPAYLTPEGFWPRTIAIDLAGQRCRQLPPGERLVHSILHTEVADLNFAAGDWPLRYLYETAVLTRDPATAIDWSVVESLAGDDLGLPLRAHLYAANRLFGGKLGEGFAESPRLRRHFRRCRLNARYPRSVRRVNMLAYKFRQAMTPWYLRRKGYLPADAGPARGHAGLWSARVRALADLVRHHGLHLPRLLFGDDDDSVPPPRV